MSQKEGSGFEQKAAKEAKVMDIEFELGADSGFSDTHPLDRSRKNKRREEDLNRRQQRKRR